LDGKIFLERGGGGGGGGAVEAEDGGVVLWRLGGLWRRRNVAVTRREGTIKRRDKRSRRKNTRKKPASEGLGDQEEEKILHQREGVLHRRKERDRVTFVFKKKGNGGGLEKSVPKKASGYLDERRI